MAGQYLDLELRAVGAADAGGLTTGARDAAAAVGRGIVRRHGSLIRLALAIAVILLALHRWDAGAAFFLGLLACSVMGLIDGRVSIAAGLLCIALCPLLLIADQQAWLERSALVNYYAASIGIVTLHGTADEVAVWAYYFLCIGVAAQIARYGLREMRHERARA